MADIEELLAEARAARGPAPEALIRRIAADAERHRARAGSGFWARLALAFGGPAALAGMATAGVAGLCFGLADPGVLQALGGPLAGGDVLELFAGEVEIDTLLNGE